MKKWIVMLAILVMFCLAGCGEKPMTAVYFHTDDNSWYFADLDTDTIFSGTIPDKLTDENGKKLTEEDMTDGVSGNHKDGTERTGQSGKGRSLPEGAAFHDASGD